VALPYVRTVPLSRYGPDAPAIPRLARSLRVLGHDVDACWPRRSRASDGWIGDAEHQARVSDHNPDARGLVHALDITAAQIDPWAVVVAACVHPGTHYVIYRGRIFAANQQFMARKYTGPDPHNTHVHVSILHTQAAERAQRHWLVC